MRAYLQRREAERREAAALRAQRLRDAAPALARMLRERYGATRVWLFGSLAWGEPDARSDLDLAVEGLPTERYFSALGELLMSAPASVDLVRMEEAPAALVGRIREAGVVLDG